MNVRAFLIRHILGVLAFACLLVAQPCLANQTFWLQAVTATTNAPLPGASVTVYQTGTTAKATLFSTSGSPIANPMTADAIGVAQFQAPDGTYDIIASSGAYVGPTRVQVQIYDQANFINQAYFNANGSAQFLFTTAVAAATTTTLPANTYANGTLGVGATLTGNSNGALAAQDGVTLSVNQRLWVKNEAAPANNGIYALTTVGSGGAPYVLTRTTDADTAALLGRVAATASGGSVNTGLAYAVPLAAANIVVGMTALNPVLVPGGATATAPAGTLTGATLASNVLASSLTSIGTLTSLTVAGTDPVFNGLTVGLGNSGVAFNTVLGQGAFAANASGAFNDAIGYFALAANTTGDNNIAIGYQSLLSNTTGINSIAIGSGALQTNTTGAQNIAIGGVGALSLNTTGYFNVGVGIDALSANTTGINNTALSNALGDNTTGSYGTGIGWSALFGNTTGNFNVGVGYGAAGNNVAGTYNTGLGSNALFNVSAIGSGSIGITGSYNTAVGGLALNDLGFVIGATSLANGLSYTIFQVGTTDFTAVGAASNTVGVTFTATGPGTGTGVVLPNIAQNDNTALGYNTGRGIVYGINNTILGANVTGLGLGLSNAIILATGQGTIRADFGKTTSSQWTLSSAMTMTGAASAAGASQISYGGTTTTGSTCPTGTVGGQTVIGCEIHNVAGTNHYVPYF